YIDMEKLFQYPSSRIHGELIAFMKRFEKIEIWDFTHFAC
ncbi:hypothetical protein A2U01_0111408, partial [Trifolium medium]|nr:hypothetical protein [Trifolium medium]